MRRYPFQNCNCWRTRWPNRWRIEAFEPCPASGRVRPACTRCRLCRPPRHPVNAGCRAAAGSCDPIGARGHSKPTRVDDRGSRARADGSGSRDGTRSWKRSGARPVVFPVSCESLRHDNIRRHCPCGWRGRNPDDVPRRAAHPPRRPACCPQVRMSVSSPQDAVSTTGRRCGLNRRVCSRRVTAVAGTRCHSSPCRLAVGTRQATMSNAYRGSKRSNVIPNLRLAPATAFALTPSIPYTVPSGARSTWSAWILELDELFRIVRQIESFLVRNGPDSPLLHRQGTKQNLDPHALLVIADLVGHQRVSRNRTSLNFRFEKGGCAGLPNRTSERGSDWTGRRGRFQNLGDRRNHIRIPSAGVEQRPALSAVNVNHLSDASHTLMIVVPTGSPVKDTPPRTAHVLRRAGPTAEVLLHQAAASLSDRGR